MQEVQSVLFPKQNFNKRTATDWLKKNKMKHYTSRKTTNFIRFRQVNPQLLTKQGYDKIFTKKIGNDGVELIVYQK